MAESGEIPEDDYEDEDDWDYECGANGENDIVAWQRCTMAGTEYCDFECPHARAVRAKLRHKRTNRRRVRW